MTENIEKNPQIWERLFPDSKRRRLAQEYTQRLSEIEGVNRVVAIKVDNGDEKEPEQRQMVLVFTEGSDTTPNLDILEEVLSAYNEVCSDKSTRELLGQAQVVTRGMFANTVLIDPGYEGFELTTLWQKPKKELAAVAKS